MVKLWGQNTGAYALATVPLAAVLLVAGRATLPARGQSGAQPPAAPKSITAARRPFLVTTLPGIMSACIQVSGPSQGGSRAA
jgi:hypothetical protein